VTEAFDADSERRFGGLARLYGAAGAARIRAAHVAVVGIGGVGSWAAEALARSGVAQLTLIDMDHVAESNVNRQVHALTGTLGQAKVTAMRERIAQIHPQCRVHEVDAFVEPDNWPQLPPQPVDALIDACDQARAKLALVSWARASVTLFVTVGAAGGKRHGERVEIADIAAVTHDPLIAQLRYRLRREGCARRPASRSASRPCSAAKASPRPIGATCRPRWTARSIATATAPA
jgi:tRNA A37 threonylcarbamoyladenosine dehydratase